MRDGTGRKVEGNQHPDPRAEAVRWAICEAELIQAIGRGRGVNRSADNPLQIDILTNVCLPIEVDEVTTWDAYSRAWPRSCAPAARCRSATAIWRRRTRICSPSADAAENGAADEKTPANVYREISNRRFVGFLSVGYRRTGSRTGRRGCCTTRRGSIRRHGCRADRRCDDPG